MFERVLLPVNLTQESDALACFLVEPNSLGAEEVVLLNVVEVGPQIGFASDTFERVVAWRRDAEERLGELRARIGAKGIRCRWRLEMGVPGLEVLRVAEEERSALIMLGTHGHGLFRRIMRRSVTGSVVSRAHTPILVTRFPAGKSLMHLGAAGLESLSKRLLYATDFSECAQEALAYVKRLATPVSEVVALHVRTAPRRPEADAPELLERRMEQIRAGLEFIGCSATWRVLDGNPARSISRTARELDATLIVMGTTGRGSPRGRSMGSTASLVIRDPVSPLLMVPLGTD